MEISVFQYGLITNLMSLTVAGMGAALIPRSVLSTFPESKRLSIHPLPRGDNEAQTVILDPVGNWYGLRLDATGKKAMWDIPVFGGE